MMLKTKKNTSWYCGAFVVLALVASGRVWAVGSRYIEITREEAMFQAF